MAGWHLAQFNVARLLAPLDDPATADFVAALDRINELGEASAGFVWRLSTDEGDATAVRAYEDERVIVNFTVWESLDALAEFTYRSAHTDVMRQRRRWFEPREQAHLVLWWVPAGVVPTVAEAVAKLQQLREQGPGPDAFTFRQPFPPPEGTSVIAADERNVCGV